MPLPSSDRPRFLPSGAARVRALLVALVALGHAAVGHAAVKIDPDAVGATDVTPADIESNPLQPAIDLTVGDASSGTLRIDAGSTVKSNVVLLGNDASAVGTTTVTGAGSLSTNNELLFVGYFGDGALRVEDRGTVTSSWSRIGQEAGSTGVATVTGAGSAWRTMYTLTVGYAGDGELHVEDGGLVTAPNKWIAYGSGSTGVATVTGAGSNWTGNAALYVGYGGAGSLTIQEGGRVVNGQAGGIGYLAGSTGEATVSGIGSTWISNDTVVGDRGAGTLTIRDGGAVSTGNEGRIGSQTGSTGEAMVTGAGSLWNLTRSLHVGDSGDGALRVEDGGVVISSNSTIGTSLGSSGAATITGVGSQWNLRSLSALSVGVRDDGTLTVEAGGEVNNFTGSIGVLAGSKGVVTVTGAGSKWNNAEQLTVGNSGDGTLRVEDGGFVVSRSTYIAAVTGATGEAVVTGALSEWTLDQLSVGRSGRGKLRVEAGGLVDADSARIGDLAGSTGEALVTGAGSRWTVAYSLQVGAQSDGALRVEAGGVVTSKEGGVGYSPGATGVATVTGALSQWNNTDDLLIGVQDDADGALRIEAGGVVSNGRGYLGYRAGSVGAATVSGAGSKWDNSGAFYVGSLGAGTLRIEDGGLVTTDSFSRIGASAGSMGAATVSGAGSKWNSSGTLYVGSSGNGALRVEAGGVVASADGIIALSPGSSGVATITGFGSQWTNSGALYVSHGALHVEAGGVADNEVAFIGIDPGSTGAATVEGAGSQWRHSVGLYVGGGVSTAGGGATLDILDQGEVSVAGTTKLWAEGSVTLGDGGVLRTERLDLTAGEFQMHTGGRLEAGDVIGDLENLSGVVAPHIGVGVMTVSGAYNQGAAATLAIELAGADAGQFDALAIDGAASLRGALSVSLLGGYTPVLGDLFTIIEGGAIDSAAVSGAFDTLDFTAAVLPAGLEWRVDYDTDRVDLLVVEATPPLTGDYNSDGVVDAADYTVWRDGASPDGSPTDYDLWAANYGATSTPLAPGAVPEPTTTLLLMGASVSAATLRSRSPRRVPHTR